MVNTYKILKSIVNASPVIDLTLNPDRPDYGTFVFSCLATVTDPEDYAFLGLSAEIGEVSQVLCKHLRVNRDASGDLVKLFDELADCVYWYTVNPHMDHAGYFLDMISELEDLLVETWIDPSSDLELVPGGTLWDYLEQVNLAKLTKRKADLGSFIKE